MLTALVFASLSAVCMALMIVTDRLMVGDCYRGNSNHAWFVSSLAGSLFGLLLTAIIWLWGSFFLGTPTFGSLLEMAGTLFVWKGLAAFVVGVLGIQMLLHYFRCFSEEAHSSVIAAWLAATPIFVYLVMLVLGHFIGLEDGSSSGNSLWVIGLILATGGLIAFERLTGGPKGSLGVYRKELIILLAVSVIYTIALKQVFMLESDSTDAMAEAIALMPFYWLGFAAGMRIMLKAEERHTFKANWLKRIRYFVAPILFVEIIGMLVFFFEYLSLTALDPTTVSLILGLHIILVYVLDLLLGWFRLKMEKSGEQSVLLWGVRLLCHKLPETKLEAGLIVKELFLLLIITIGIALVTMQLG